MLNRSLHETHLRRILNNIFENKTLASQLAFKGGTCLYLFYGLDRFSTDLDFNALTEDLDVEQLTKVISDYGIEDSNFTDKRLTWFWLLAYAKKTMNIKLEVSKRDYPDTYEIKELLGVRVKCMTMDCMFAHKLCAVTDRAKLVNRDLYDSLFMFNKDFPINEAIIKMRTGKTVIEYLSYLVDFIEQKVEPQNILSGLGEVLTEAQKDRAKVKLKPDLVFAIRNYIASNTPRANLEFDY